MFNALSIIDVSEVNVVDADNATMMFVDDADYEFVGGGNAVNSY